MLHHWQVAALRNLPDFFSRIAEPALRRRRRSARSPWHVRFRVIALDEVQVRHTFARGKADANC
jgi:hypothetical protein